MQEQNLGKLNILVAVYGLKTITSYIQNLVARGIPETLSLIVNNKVIGTDGWEGQRKSLTILYNYDGGEPRVATAREGDIITINPDALPKPQLLFAENPPGRNGFSILAASYGPDDVTYKVKKMISSYNTLSFTVNNTLFGDTWYGVPKTLVIILGSGDKVRAVEIFIEREPCYLDLNEVIPAI